MLAVSFAKIITLSSMTVIEFAWVEYAMVAKSFFGEFLQALIFEALLFLP